MVHSAAPPRFVERATRTRSATDCASAKKARRLTVQSVFPFGVQPRYTMLYETLSSPEAASRVTWSGQRRPLPGKPGHRRWSSRSCRC